MGFFKRLYTGEICPIESVVRDTAEYNDAIHKLNMAADSLERTLSDTQKELLQQLNDAKADIDTLLQAEAYRLGFMNGMEMKQDAGLAALAGMFSSAVSATYGLLNLLCMIAFAYCVIKIFFANIKRGGILLIQNSGRLTVYVQRSAGIYRRIQSMVQAGHCDLPYRIYANNAVVPWTDDIPEQYALGAWHYAGCQ